jgi:hypothetical protein
MLPYSSMSSRGLALPEVETRRQLTGVRSKLRQTESSISIVYRFLTHALAEVLPESVRRCYARLGKLQRASAPK